MRRGHAREFLLQLDPTTDAKGRREKLDQLRDAAVRIPGMGADVELFAVSVFDEDALGDENVSPEDVIATLGSLRLPLIYVSVLHVEGFDTTLLAPLERSPGLVPLTRA